MKILNRDITHLSTHPSNYSDGLLMSIRAYTYQEMWEAVRNKISKAQFLPSRNHPSLLENTNMSSKTWAQVSTWRHKVGVSTLDTRSQRKLPKWERWVVRAWETGCPGSRCNAEKQHTEMGRGWGRHTRKYRVLSRLFLSGWAEYEEMKQENTVSKACHVTGILDFNQEIHRNTPSKKN